MVQLVTYTGYFYDASLYIQLLSVTYIFRDRHLCGDDWAAHVAVRATSTWWQKKEKVRSSLHKRNREPKKNNN